MDPLTAALNLITAITNLAMVCAEGQTPEQRAKIWGWWIKDMTKLRLKLGIDDPEPPATKARSANDETAVEKPHVLVEPARGPGDDSGQDDPRG